MQIAGVYSFNDGENVVNAKHSNLLAEIKDCISALDASQCKTKESKEKTMPGQMLYSPVSLNKQFKAYLHPLEWESIRVKCDYPTQFYAADYQHKQLRKGAFREMDFVKEKLGVEVQFGKYSFRHSSLKTCIPEEDDSM